LPRLEHVISYLFTCLFLYIDRTLFTCIQVTFHVAATRARNIISIYMSLFMYISFFSHVYRSLFMLPRLEHVISYLFPCLFSYIHRTLFTCIQVSFHVAATRARNITSIPMSLFIYR